MIGNMREIEFKGIHKGHFVYGNLVVKTDYDGTVYIEIERAVMRDFANWSVERSTVCQYTGLIDKKSMKIYESDYLQDHRGNVWVVEWDSNHACFICRNMIDRHVVSVIDNENMVVVGNIHQHKELLDR